MLLLHLSPSLAVAMKPLHNINTLEDAVTSLTP